MSELKKYVELEFLKDMSHEEINAVLNKQHDRIADLEKENRQLKEQLRQAKTQYHNEQRDCGVLMHEITQLFDYFNIPDVIDDEDRDPFYAFEQIKEHWCMPDPFLREAERAAELPPQEEGQ